MSNQDSVGKVGKMIGIDLGTTNTAVAYMKGREPDILFGRDGKPLTRSAVSLYKRHKVGEEDEGEILVGNAAFKNLPRAPEDTIISIKRLMGIGFNHPEAKRVNENFQYKVVKPSSGTEDAVRVLIGGKEFAPEDISAMILRTVKNDAEERLGEEVTHAVITVPAYFDQSQKAATLKAGIKAGLRVLKLLDEPTAAAIAYGMDDADSGESKYVVVYDLGGGTFDVSVLMWVGTAFVPMNIEGDMWLGGDNFDQEIINYVKKQVISDYGIDPSSNQHFMGKLKVVSQEVKESLSYQNSADIIIDNMLMDDNGMPLDIIVEITREQYEDMIRPYVQRSIDLVSKAIDNANLSIEIIDHILLTGNASMTPLVEKMVSENFGVERILKRKQPKHCVAQGAAIVAKVYNSVHCPECGFANDLMAEQCKKCKRVLNKLICPHCDTGNEPGAEVCANCQQSLSEVRSTQEIQWSGISSRYYGIQYRGDKFAVFVHKNDPIPTPQDKKQSQKFRVTQPNQRMLYVPVYGGEDIEIASKNTKQGEVFAILPAGLPKGTEVEISLWLDNDEVFDLSAELEDGTELEPWIIKGEGDQYAVQLLDDIDKKMRNKSGLMDSDQKASAEESREKAFDYLKAGDFESAIQELEDLIQFLDLIIPPSIGNAGGGNGSGDDLEDRARALIGFSEFLISDYDWLLGSEKVRTFRQAIDSAKSSMQLGNKTQLLQDINNLEDATEKIPDVLKLLLGLKMAIAQKIEPVAPTKAIKLKDELAETERTLKNDLQEGMKRLIEVMEKVDKTIKEVGEQVSKPKPCPVPGCSGVVEPGAYKCSKGHPTIDRTGSSIH